jgi:diadenosine tetraphosphate (Ap4A) HIT family hydrolase
VDKIMRTKTPQVYCGYDPNNIFAKIIRGEFPCHKVYEDDKSLVFLDIMPRAPGHMLVLPSAGAHISTSAPLISRMS